MTSNVNMVEGGCGLLLHVHDRQCDKYHALPLHSAFCSSHVTHIAVPNDTMKLHF